MNATRARFSLRLVVAVVGFGLITFLLSSCPQPIDLGILNHVKDTIGPSITIVSPSENDYCANIVQVDGSVADSADEAGLGDGEVWNLAYEVLGSTISGSVEVQGDGTFNFQFETTTLGDSFALVVTATDWNGNATTYSLSLRKQAGDGIPSFSADAGIGTVTLTWDDIPHTQSYSLRYTTNGALPSETVGFWADDVTSPFVVPDDLPPGVPPIGREIRNGNLHVFQLTAVPEVGWTESKSDYESAIPMSDQTLAPTVTGGIEEIYVEWHPIPATDEFEVWRARFVDGPYYNLSGPISATSYLDQNVDDGTWYYYKVTAAGYEDEPRQRGGGAAQTQLLNFYDPYVVAALDTPGEAYRVRVDGDYAYIADVSRGVRIFNVLDPENAFFVGGFDTDGSTYDVLVNGEYVYVADAANGLVVLDVTDRAFPTAATIDTDGFAVGLAINGDYLYLADFDSIQVYDIMTAGSPSNVGSVAVGTAFGLSVANDHLYVTSFDDDPDPDIGTYYLRVFDISGGFATAPNLVATSLLDDLTHATWGVAVKGDYVFVADRFGGLKIFHWNPPASLALVNEFETAGGPHEIAFIGDLAYIADERNGLLVLDASDPASMTIDSIIAWRPTQSFGGGLGVAVKGHYAFMAEYIHGMTVIKCSAPTNPKIVGSVSGLSNPMGVVVQGDYAYIADWAGGLQLINVSDPVTPWLDGNAVILDSVVVDVAVRGDYAVITGILEVDPSGEFVQLVNVLDPAAPAGLGSVDTTGGTFSIDLTGPYALSSNGSQGLFINDISDPDNPVIAFGAGTNGFVNDAAVAGSYAYVADSHEGLRVIDISVPEEAGVVAEARLTGFPEQYAHSVAVSGSYAYVVETDEHRYTPYDDPDEDPDPVVPGELQIIDISDPLDPVALDSDGGTPFVQGYQVALQAQSLAVEGPYAFVVDLANGLEVIDVSDPATPLQIATLTIPGGANDIVVSGRYAYITTRGGWFHVVDLLWEP